MASPERRLRLLEPAALALVGVLALAFQARLPGKLPTEADYQAVAETLKREAKPGDVLLLFPWWAERARLFAPASLPVVGYLGSDADPLTAHPRIWLLSQPELPGNETSAFERAFLPDRSRVGAPRDFGHLRLALYRNGRHRPQLFSAADAIAQARVYVEDAGGARQPCAFDGQVHRCPGDLHVAAEWHEIHFQPRRCLWLAPPGGNRRLVVEFPQVPVGARLALEGGMVWDRGYFTGPQLSVTRVGVEEASTGRALAQFELPPGIEGVQRAEVPTAASGPIAVRLWSQADRAELRELCVDLFTWGEPERGTP